MASTPVGLRSFGRGRLTGGDVLSLLDDSSIQTEPESSSSDSDDPVYDLSDPENNLGEENNHNLTPTDGPACDTLLLRSPPRYVGACI